MTNLDSRLALALDIAREAGALARSYFDRLPTLAVEFKTTPQDVVSVADREVERLIRARIAASFPLDGVLGEEDGLQESRSEALWVVDPIDGTSCFLAGLPNWCVSIAVAIDGQPVIGVIYVPVADELFAAAAGRGATLNGVPMAVDGRRGLTQGLLGIGANHHVAPHLVGELAQALLQEGGMFYRNGSGALMLAYVACGRLVGYFEHHINSWDCLAGLCLIREAGGWVNDFLGRGGFLTAGPVAGGAPQVEAPLKALIAQLGLPPV